MPQAHSTVEGMVIRPYRSGLKVDGQWYPYADENDRPDIRPGDAVKLTVDAGGSITAVEITQRGNGVAPEEKISDKQKGAIEKFLDDKDLDQDFLNRFVGPLTGQTLDDFSKVRAGALLTLITGRQFSRGRQGGNARRRTG